MDYIDTWVEVKKGFFLSLVKFSDCFWFLVSCFRYLLEILWSSWHIFCAVYRANKPFSPCEAHGKQWYTVGEPFQRGLYQVRCMWTLITLDICLTILLLLLRQNLLGARARKVNKVKTPNISSTQSTVLDQWVYPRLLVVQMMRHWLAFIWHMSQSQGSTRCWQSLKSSSIWNDLSNIQKLLTSANHARKTVKVFTFLFVRLLFKIISLILYTEEVVLIEIKGNQWIYVYIIF